LVSKPFAFHIAGLLHTKRKSNTGIRTHTRMKVCSKHFLAIESTDKPSNKVRGYEFAPFGSTETGFHGVANNGMNFNH